MNFNFKIRKINVPIKFHLKKPSSQSQNQNPNFILEKHSIKIRPTFITADIPDYGPGQSLRVCPCISRDPSCWHGFVLFSIQFGRILYESSSQQCTMSSIHPSVHTWMRHTYRRISIDEFHPFHSIPLEHFPSCTPYIQVY